MQHEIRALFEKKATPLGQLTKNLGGFQKRLNDVKLHKFITGRAVFP